VGTARRLNLNETIQSRPIPLRLEVACRMTRSDYLPVSFHPRRTGGRYPPLNERKWIARTKGELSFPLAQVSHLCQIHWAIKNKNGVITNA
jgi:hypothetical protein